MRLDAWSSGHKIRFVNVMASLPAAEVFFEDIILHRLSLSDFEEGFVTPNF